MKQDGNQQVSTHPPASEKSGPRLPHEHDESHDSQKSEPRKDMKQAHADISSGQVDTDLHGARGVESVQGGKLDSSSGSDKKAASPAPPSSSRS